jgi:putative ABC transport system ATP-binding protein
MSGSADTAEKRPLLECRSLAKTFDRSVPDARPALDRLSLSVRAGEFVVVIGSNGAGKSTLLNVIAGMVLPDSGAVWLEGQDITRLAPHRRAGRITRVFQDPMAGTASAMTIEENLALAERRGARHRLLPHLTSQGRERYRALLAGLNLGLEARLGTPVAQLSGGQRQALSLMMAVLSSPALLLLDEHTAALDPRTAELVMAATMAAVRERRLTTLMVTHNMRQAIETGDRLIMMDAGRVMLDISGQDKALLEPGDLVEKFRLASDRMLLAS